MRSAILVGYESLAADASLTRPACCGRSVLRSAMRADRSGSYVRKVFRLLELSAKDADRPDFGLMLPERRRLSYLGGLGLRVA